MILQGKRIGPDSQMGNFPNIFKNICLRFFQTFPQYFHAGNILEKTLQYFQKHFLKIYRKMKQEHYFLMDDFLRKYDGGLFHDRKPPDIPKNLDKLQVAPLKD